MQNFVTGIMMLALTAGLYIIYLRNNRSKLKKAIQKGLRTLFKTQ